MEIKTTYFVKFENDTYAWLGIDVEIPAGATIIEERPMIMPSDGKVLRHKETGEMSFGHWLQNDSSDNWEEIEEPKEAESLDSGSQVF